MSDDLVERVARAMWMADPEPYDPSDRRPFEEADWEAQRNYRAEARAAIALVLEEAAKVADDEASHCEDTGSAPSDFGNAGRNDAARTIAAAIRAMVEE